MTKKRFAGINAALYTAYNHDGSVNFDETGRLAGWLIERGISGLYLCGTTGDGLLLSLEERRRIVETVSRIVGDQVPLMVHVGTLATKDAVELARHAAQLDGVAAISSLGPIYYPLPWRDQMKHLSTIAEATNLPFYPYLFSDAVQAQGVATVLASFAELPHMAGIKAFVQDLSVHQQILASGPAAWELLHGHDQCLAQALAIPGVDGAIGSMYNVVPEIALAVYQAAQAGDFAHAAECHQTFSHYWLAACSSGSPLPIGRYWLNRRGLTLGEPRLPKRFPPPADIEVMEKALEKSGFDITAGGM